MLVAHHNLPDIMRTHVILGQHQFWKLKAANQPQRSYKGIQLDEFYACWHVPDASAWRYMSSSS